MKRVAFAAALLAVVVLAAFLRFDRLGQPSYWLDEVLGDQLTTKAAGAPVWKWVTGLEREHGPLYYATQLAGRLAGRDEFGGRLPAALFGVATVPLIAFAIRYAGGSALAAIAGALLLAISPFHVYYSREARPYALLMLLTAVVLSSLLSVSRWFKNGGVAAAFALLYTSAVSAPMVAGIAVVAGVAGIATPDTRTRRRDWILAAASVLALILFPLLYGGTSSRQTDEALRSVDARTLTTILRGFSISATAAVDEWRVAVAVGVAALIGAIALVVRNRRAALIVIGMAVVPVVFTLTTLRLFGHWFSLRYVAMEIVPFLVLAGIGLVAVMEWLLFWARRWPRARAVAVGVLAAAAIGVIGSRTWLAARREPFEKLDWRGIAAALEKAARPGDAIIAAEAWSDACLRHYIHLPAGVKLSGVSSVPIAEMVVSRYPSVWFVTAGFSTDTSVREWMCRYPLLTGSRLEEFRLHYAPSAEHFLRERSGPAEVRSFSAGLGPHTLNIRLGMNDEFVLGAGWAGAEGKRPDTFRWAMAHEAAISFPRTGVRDRVVRIHALPVMHPSLPPQTLEALVNGTSIAAVTMKNDWSDYVFAAPAALWRDGVNTLVLRFGRITSPKQLHGAGDERTLAAAVDDIVIVDADETPMRERSIVPPPRLASDDLFASKVVDHARRTRFPLSRLRRDEVLGLLGRIGFDPEPAWSRIASGSVYIEDVAASLVPLSACQDDHTFLEQAFAALVQRQPNPIERRELMSMMKTGEKRAQIIRQVLRADDFRSRMLR